MSELEQYAGFDGFSEDTMLYLIFEATIHMPGSHMSRRYNLEISDDKTWQSIVLSDPKYMNLENLQNSHQL